MTTPDLGSLLVDKYGALMSSRDLAELLATTEVRVTNGFANNLPWTQSFRVARLKIGRRVYFNTVVIAKTLEVIQRKESLKTTKPVSQVCVRVGTRKRGTTRCFISPRQLNSFFGNNEFFARTTRKSPRRIRTGLKNINASPCVLGATHKVKIEARGVAHGN